jgi:hypothetical protein
MAEFILDLMLIIEGFAFRFGEGRRRCVTVACRKRWLTWTEQNRNMS